MADEQELRQEGWEAHDLRSGVAKVFAEAKRRSTLGIRVAAVWSVIVILFGVFDFAGVAEVAFPFWDLAAGFGAILLTALSVSRAPGPLLGAGGVIVADLVVIAYNFPEMIDHGSISDHLGTAVRIGLAPIALFFVLNGYFGSLAYQAFKQGFSAGADWRTRMSPRMMQVVVVGSCGSALLLGVATWFGAIMSGFAQTNVTWITMNLLKKPVNVTVGKVVDVKEAGTDGKKPGVFVDITVLNRKSTPSAEVRMAFPESATPIADTEGLDDFAKAQVEEAFEFAADTDQAGCMLEGQGRQDRCRDDRCRYWARVFARACLPNSKKTEHFCDEVPEALEEDAGLAWAQRMCAGRNFETCREILYAAQGHCHPPKSDQAKGEGDVAKAGAAKADAAAGDAKAKPKAD